MNFVFTSGREITQNHDGSDEKVNVPLGPMGSEDHKVMTVDQRACAGAERGHGTRRVEIAEKTSYLETAGEEIPIQEEA